MKRFLLPVITLLFLGCVELTFTAKMPCLATVTKGDSLSDTLYKMTTSEDSCPKAGK